MPYMVTDTICSCNSPPWFTPENPEEILLRVEEDKVSVKRSCLSSDEDKKLEDSEEDSAATVTKSKPVRSTKGAKKGEPPVKLEASADDDDDVENFAEA
ncbi:hypothetical protein PC116_g29492 [Phytophthora cactorum]|nr:hypothetical protein PC116_g29492 [Phytophthora cactorum]